MVQWLIALSWVSIALGHLTAGVIAGDVVRHPQSMAIMNIVWPITGHYFPLIGLWFNAAMRHPMRHR